jgi:hypothetical protein
VPSMVGPALTGLHRPKGPHHQAFRGVEGREEADERRIIVVTSPVGAPVVHRMTRITIGPRGRPQGPLAPQTEPSPPPSLTSPTLTAPPPPPPTLPSAEASPRLWDTDRSVKSVRQSGTLAIRPLHRPVWQRPCARVL